MKKYLLCLFSLFLTINSFAQEVENEETTVYYLIRHAEKDRSNAKERNPNLTEKGKQRAENWSKILANVSFDFVYSTDYNRTQQTASPTAKKNNLKITSYHPYKIDFTRFLEDTKGKNVLVVGHSNTTPDFVNKLIGKQKFKHIDDRNNGNLYIVTITGTSKSVSLLSIN